MNYLLKHAWIKLKKIFLARFQSNLKGLKQEYDVFILILSLNEWDYF